MTLLTMPINLFRGTYDPRPAKTLTLAQALEPIRHGTYRQQIEGLRHSLSLHGKSFYLTFRTPLEAIDVFSQEHF